MRIPLLFFALFLASAVCTSHIRLLVCLEVFPPCFRPPAVSSYLSLACSTYVVISPHSCTYPVKETKYPCLIWKDAKEGDAYKKVEEAAAQNLFTSMEDAQKGKAAYECAVQAQGNIVGIIYRYRV